MSFIYFLLMLASNWQYRGEKDACYNNLSCLKYTRSNHFAKAIYRNLFNIPFSLIFCMSSFFNGMKSYITFATKFIKTLLHLLLLYSFLTQLWISLKVIHLSGDVELNPGPKRDSNQYLSVFHWNLNSPSPHHFSKLQSLIVFT